MSFVTRQHRKEAGMSGDEVCGVCGFSEELQPLEVWRDADGEGWWVHQLCLENRPGVAS